MKHSKKLAQARQRGRNDFARGVAYAENPYAATPLHGSWQRGWKEAKEEREKESARS